MADEIQAGRAVRCGGSGERDGCRMGRAGARGQGVCGGVARVRGCRWLGGARLSVRDGLGAIVDVDDLRARHGLGVSSAVR
jgi:hypothetical protein